MTNRVASEVIEIMEDDDSVGEECWDLLEVRVAIYSSKFLVVVLVKKCIYRYIFCYWNLYIVPSDNVS
jgi:hypothetical protein